MRIALTTLDVLIAIALIISVLLQSGRSAGLGSISGGGEALFGKKKGLDDFLSRVSGMLAGAFLVLTLIISLL